jgi:tRNA dimethylallyltransferase
MQRVIVLAGLTGVGKTSLALRLAEDFPCTVINADSRQVYAEFPIITAQPTAVERSVCPHALYGFLSCREKITAGAFSRLCSEAVDATLAEGRQPLIVGGTGLYLRSLLHGLAPIPEVPASVSEALARNLEEQGLPMLRERLEAVDPDYAATIHPNDTQRTLRALEVHAATGRPLSWWHARPVDKPPFQALQLVLGVELAELEPLLRGRIDLMLQAGAVEEARQAWRSCADPAAPGWSSIGCAELLAYIRGECGLEQARERWFRNTRAYAKRQSTWFRKEQGVHWLRPGEEDKAVALARAFLQEQEGDA